MNEHDQEDTWSDTCAECQGEGEILVCPDDMCRGMQECVHVDGYRPCRACHGAGYVSRPTPKDSFDAGGMTTTEQELLIAQEASHVS